MLRLHTRKLQYKKHSIITQKSGTKYYNNEDVETIAFFDTETYEHRKSQKLNVKNNNASNETIDKY